MSFPMVALGEILTKSDEWIDINPIEKYQQVTVRLWGKGVMMRDEVNGAEIAASKRLVVHPQQFIVSRIDARNGAFGLIPDSLEGAVVSSDFPVFTVNPSRILPKYLNWMSKTHFFVDLCKAASEGTTNRVRLKEDRFLIAKIPLPPLPEQRRIVAHIEELAAKIEEARGLRGKAGEEVEALLSSALHRQFNSAKTADIPKQSIATLATIFRGRGPVYQEGSGKLAINQKCVRWNGIDIVHAKEVSEGWIQSLPSNSFLQENDILVNSTGEGTIGRACILTQNAIGFPFDSHVLVVRVKKDKVLPTLITYYLRSPCGQEAIEDSKGAKTTKQTELGTTKLGEIIIPLPPLPEQRHIVAYLDTLQAKVDALRRLQTDTGAELDALMPAVLDRAFKGEL